MHALKCCSCPVSKLCPTLCDPMDYSQPDSSVHGISPARILAWVAISSSGRSSRPRDQTYVSHNSRTGKRILYHWAAWEAHLHWYLIFVFLLGFTGSSAGKESTFNAGDPSSTPGLGRSAGEGIGYTLQYPWASFVAQLVRNLPAVWENWVRSLGWEDPLEKKLLT